MKNNGYKDLIVWQKSMDLVVAVYALASQLPKTEIYGIISQIQRAAVSIPSNIAEGSRRKTKNDTNHFFTIAFGSGAEVETQIEILKRLPFGKNLDYITVDMLLQEIMKILNKMTNYY